MILIAYLGKYAANLGCWIIMKNISVQNLPKFEPWT